MIPHPKQIRALQHILFFRCVKGIAQGPGGKVCRGISCHHAPQALLPGGNQQPVALLFLIPEYIGIPEVITGIILCRIKGVLRNLGPVHIVLADGVHHAFSVKSFFGKGIIMPCIKAVISAVPVLNHASGSDGQIRFVAGSAERNHQAIVPVFIKICRRKFVDRMISHPIMICII